MQANNFVYEKRVIWSEMIEDLYYICLLYTSLSKNNLNVDDEGILDKVVSDTDGYTQAEIEAVVVKTLELVKRSNGGFGTMEALVQAKNFMISAQNSNIRQMEDLALVECNDGEFIPAHMKERHMKLMHVNPDQSEISGTIDRTRTSEER